MPGQSSRVAQCCGEGRPSPPRQPPGASSIFNGVYYSCFVSGKEPELLTEEPRPVWRAEQWVCSPLQPSSRTPRGALYPSCWPSAQQHHKTIHPSKAHCFQEAFPTAQKSVWGSNPGGALTSFVVQGKLLSWRTGCCGDGHVQTLLCRRDSVDTCPRSLASC